jgi:hypothetical protein
MHVLPAVHLGLAEYVLRTLFCCVRVHACMGHLSELMFLVSATRRKKLVDLTSPPRHTPRSSAQVNSCASRHMRASGHSACHHMHVDVGLGDVPPAAACTVVVPISEMFIARLADRVSLSDRATLRRGQGARDAKSGHPLAAARASYRGLHASDLVSVQKKRRSA